VSRRTAAALAWSLVAVSLALGGLGTALRVAADGFDSGLVAEELVAALLISAVAAVGALVASRLPANPIGWIFVGFVAALCLSGVTDSYVALEADDPRPGVLAAWAAWFSAKVFVAFFATIFFTVLFFPDGRLPTRRWRAVLWTGTAGLVLFAAAVFVNPGRIDDYPRYTNPTGLDVPGRSAIFGLGFLLFALGLVGAAAALVVRFRRARGIERQQLTVLLGAGAVATVLFVSGAALETLFGSEKLQVATLVGVFLIPAAIGVAMLRYRLYDIDRVISRTLVYGLLTVMLGAAYAGLVLAGQAVFAPVAGGSDLAIAGSTLVVAALFLPLRARVQRFVDRRFYRRRYDAQRTLEAFGARLREQVELRGLRTDLEAVVHETMQPAHLSLWVRGAQR
jgi:hypothetical protein